MTLFYLLTVTSGVLLLAMPNGMTHEPTNESSRRPLAITSHMEGETMSVIDSTDPPRVHKLPQAEIVLPVPNEIASRVEDGALAATLNRANVTLAGFDTDKLVPAITGFIDTSNIEIELIARDSWKGGAYIGFLITCGDEYQIKCDTIIHRTGEVEYNGRQVDQKRAVVTWYGPVQITRQ